MSNSRIVSALRQRCAALLAVCLLAGPSCAAPAPPNVVFIVVDDLNAELAGFGAPRIIAPNIERIAARGVRFTRAYAQYPQCNQSRASLLTGLYPDQTGVLDLDSSFRDTAGPVTTLPQHFRNAGYHTARVGKIFHQGVPAEIGTAGADDPLSWDETENPRGLDVELDDEVDTIAPPGEKRPGLGGLLSWLAVPGDGAELTDGRVASAAIDIAERHQSAQSGKPLFLAVGFYRPHTPFIAPQRLFDLYRPGDLLPAQVPPGDRDNKPVAALADRPYQLAMSDDQKRQAIQAYYASASHVDEQIGRLIDALDDLGLRDNSIIVLLSDHGYQLGDHGLWQKGDLFENSARVPLLISYPRELPQDQAHEAVVELVDVYPTLVALAGLAPPAHALPGRNLLRAAEESGPARRTALTQASSRANWTRHGYFDHDIMGYSIRTERFRYTEWDGGAAGAELYDYAADPGEHSNLANDERHADLRRDLRKALCEAIERGRR